MAEPTMDEIVNLQNELIPCDICGRTFLLKPLEKHIRVCEKNATRKRKVFDSLKQRVEGTELEQFHQKSYLKKSNQQISEVKPLPKPTLWKEKHLELISTIRAARGAPTEMVRATPKGASSTTNVGSERCPSCDRQFGPKAYDRHVEWCKDRKIKIQKSPAEVLLAKERLEARINYRVPLPNKSKRALVRDKYLPGVGERAESVASLKSVSTPHLERGPSIRKPKSTQDFKKTENTKIKEESDFVGENKLEIVSAKKQIKEKSVPKEVIVPTVSIEMTKSIDQFDYNPFITAERQFMELLECDDFKPFVSNSPHANITQRPHTTTKVKPSTLTDTKSADIVRKPLNFRLNLNNKRASVIDPPSDFQDSLNVTSDDFELMESLVNQNLLDSELNGKNFNINSTSKIRKNLFSELRADTNKYFDDLSPIDPRLINETDNLTIPQNLEINYHSLHSSNENVSSLTTNFLRKDINNKSCNKPKLVKNNKQITDSRRVAKSKTRLNLKDTPKSTLTTSTLTSSIGGATRNNLTTEKGRNLPLLKKAATVATDTVRPKNLKSKQDVENYFEEQARRSAVKNEKINVDQQVLKNNKNERDHNSNPTAEELFAIDDEMYEEYKKYEEMYLKEKQQNAENRKRPEDIGPALEEGENVSGININSADSAYSSLNRNPPKIRARATKLAPLLRQESQSSPAGSPTSSGSETSPIFLDSGINQKMSKFCHECGNKYPIDTAKFCVECGIRRLIL